MAPFELRIDRTRRCLYITLRGHWTADIFDRFAALLMEAEREMQQITDTTYTLVDGLDFPVQDMDISERFVPLTMSLRIPASRRTALVVSEAVHMVQARSAAALVNARNFRSIESARDWLFSDEA